MTAGIVVWAMYIAAQLPVSAEQKKKKKDKVKQEKKKERRTERRRRKTRSPISQDFSQKKRKRSLVSFCWLACLLFITPFALII
jgi:hypothetical protein